MSPISDRIFCLLQERRIGQKAFARQIGVSDKTVSAWRTGRAKSYTKYLSKIAEVLGVPVEYLLEGRGTMDLPHRLGEDTPANELAAKIVQMILDSGCIYREAYDALAHAQQMLLEQTRPAVKATCTQQNI